MRAWIKRLALVGALAGGTALVGGCQDNRSGANRDVAPGDSESGMTEGTGGGGQAGEKTGGDGTHFDANGVKQGDPGTGLHSLPRDGKEPSDGKMLPQGQSTGRDDTNFDAQGVREGRVGTGFESLPSPGKEPSEGKMMPQGTGGGDQAGSDAQNQEKGESR